MKNTLQHLLVRPRVPAPLDPEFLPIGLANRAYREAVKSSPNRVPLAIAIERDRGQVSRFDTEVIDPDREPRQDTLLFAERLLKFLLWQRGGWKVTVGGPASIADHFRRTYSADGARAFDHQFMGEVYQQPFSIEAVAHGATPGACESSISLGGHLDGCRIGFDLGASDYKIAAVVDGNPVFADEIPWDPKIQPDPDWHYERINAGLKLAASKMPRVDAIGGSAAGIYIDNRVMVASLFRAVPKAVFNQKVRPLFSRLQTEWNVPLEVANDGDVTALAGGMSLNQSSILGCAMGSSQAVGFLNGQGRITGWLNELAFTPVDYNPRAPVEEWSGDRGVGALYFSQQAVVKLSPAAGIELPDGHQAEQLKHVQKLHAEGDPRAEKIFKTIGVYLGYAMAQYLDMYDYRHLLILGRVTSGKGGDCIIDGAKRVLAEEFSDSEKSVAIHVPDEKMKRVGQAVAAASLPVL